MADRKKILLRLDPEVYEAIARWAADDLRSVNAQIEYALRLALRQARRLAQGGGTVAERPVIESAGAESAGAEEADR